MLSLSPKLILLSLLLACGSAFAQDASLEGWVRDADTAVPIGSAYVSVEGISSLSCATDSLGAFSIPHLPPGTIVLHISALGYDSVTDTVEVRAESTTIVEIGLKVSPIPLKEVLVTAPRTPLSLEQTSPSFVTVIRAEEFEHRTTSVSEVLEQTTGIQVKRSGGLGAFSTVSIRGSTAEQVSVFLDGVLLNTALGGSVNMGDIPLSNVERIEVYRGTAPTEFGGNTIGGVIHIITKQDSRKIWAKVSTSYGSFGTVQTSLMGCLPTRYARWIGAVDYASSKNDFEFLDDNGTLYRKDDDEIAQRQNNQVQWVNTLLRILFDLPGHHSAEMSHNHLSKHQGLPGISNNQSLHSSLRTTRDLVEMAVHRGMPLWDLATYQGTLFFSRQRYRLKDTYGEVGFAGYRQDNDNRTTSYGGEMRLDLLPVPFFHTVVLGRYTWEGFLPKDRLSVQQVYYESHRTTRSASIEYDFTFFAERLNLSNAWHYDDVQSRYYGENPWSMIGGATPKKDHDAYPSWRGGIKAHPWPWLILKANRAHYYRVPTFYELFGDRGAVIGNNDLAAETGDNLDLGIRLHQEKMGPLSKAFLELAIYSNESDNLILFIQNAQGVAKALNISKAEVKGLEWTMSAGFWRRWVLSGNMVWQDGRDRSNIPYYRDKRLPSRPGRKGSGTMEWLLGPAKLAYDVSYESAHYLDKANQKRVPSRYMHNARLAWFAGQGLSLTVEVKNLSDNRAVDLWNYPLPGRSYFAQLEWTLE